MRRLLLVIALAATVAIVAGWFIAARIPEWFGTTPTAAATSAPPVPEPPGRKIRASLFYVSEDGASLVAVAREVTFAENTADQAREIVEEQLKPAPEPYAQALPQGTSVRSVFLTDRKEAFVDLSPEVSTGNTGGSIDELFAVYAIVNAVTVNLPAVERVQILVNGKEVDSLAGHVDLRRPLPRNLTWVSSPGTPENPPPPPPSESPSAAPSATIPASPPSSKSL